MHRKHSKKALCATGQLHTGRSDGPVVFFCQAAVFHELNASSVDLLEGGFVQSLHPHSCRPHLRLPELEPGEVREGSDGTQSSRLNSPIEQFEKSTEANSQHTAEEDGSSRT